MLVLKRKEGQWIEVTHRSGDILRFLVHHINTDFRGKVDLAFDDAARNFDIQRPERFGPKSQTSTTSESPDHP